MMTVPILFKPKRNATAPIILSCLLIASFITSALPFTGVVAIAFIWLVLSSDWQSNREAFMFVSPFIFLAALGLLMSGKNDQYEILKDSWYLAKIVLLLSVGFLLGRRDPWLPRNLRILLWVCAIGAAASLIIRPYLAEIGLIDLTLEEAQKIPLIILVCVPIILDRIQNKGIAAALPETVAFVMVVAATLLADSRIAILAFLLMVLAWLGGFSSAWKMARWATVLIPLTILIWTLLPEYRGGEMTAFNKLRRSFEEMAFTNSFDSTAMIWNWRGFEAFMAQQMFEQGSIWQKIFGFGFGSRVDIGQTVQMSEEMALRFLPTLHNGFYFVLIKFGILGVFVYFYTIIGWLWRYEIRKNSRSIEVRILRGMIVVVLAATAVITGLFNKSELHGLTLLIGYFLGFFSALQGRQKRLARRKRSLPRAARIRGRVQA